MRFHVPALPGQPTTRENSHCAYTQKVRKFCRMMVERDHEVYLYGMEQNDAPCTEHIACYPDREPPPFAIGAWATENTAVSREIAARVETGDVLCLIGGRCQEELAGLGLCTVEFGIGYGGVFAPFKVFESYAWMHAVYAQGRNDVHAVDGQFYDAVIPNAFELEEFPKGYGAGEYVLYLGRMETRKGIEIVCESARRAHVSLILAGAGDYKPNYGEHIGAVGPDERAQLLAGAIALLSPTLYLEPFGGAAVEGQLCGTPAITTDWGAFTETVLHGSTGFRCRTMGSFVDAIHYSGSLDRNWIRERAQELYSLDTVGSYYQRYVEQLHTLNSNGFYSYWSGIHAS